VDEGGTSKVVSQNFILYLFKRNIVLRRDEVTGEWRRLHNEELNDLCG